MTAAGEFTDTSSEKNTNRFQAHISRALENHSGHKSLNLGILKIKIVILRFCVFVFVFLINLSMMYFP